MSALQDTEESIPPSSVEPVQNLRKPILYEARPPRVDDAASILWMLEDLEKSGLKPSDVRAYPIASLAMGTVPAYVIGYDRPEMWVKRIKQKENKYIGPKGITDVWYSPYQDINKFHEAPVLFIIEGEKKAARFVKQWPMLNAIAIRGCRGYSEKAPDGTSVLAHNILLAVRPLTDVIAIFDGDIETNPQIKQAAHGLAYHLAHISKSFQVRRPPLGKGVDDWLQADEKATLEDLVPVDLGTVEETRKQIIKAAGVMLDADGGFVKNENNAAKIIKYIFKEEVRNDKRLGLIFQGSAYPSAMQVEHRVCLWMQEHISAHLSMPVLVRAYEIFLEGMRTDLIQKLVRELEWDGKPRLETWALDYFAGEIPKQTAEWGRLLMTGLGLRILEPASKVDYAFILIGPQGIGKTTFLEELATFDGLSFYSTLSEIPRGGADSNRTMSISFQKSIVVDLAEGMIFDSRLSNVEAVKQLITQTSDQFRQIYSKHIQVEPRGFVFCGTTNRTDHLSDASGSRRFMNLSVTSIKRLPYEEKLQILAEVVARRDSLGDWYNLRLTLDDMPEQLRQENPHVKNPQELINTQYHKPDSQYEDILQLLESGQALALKGEPRSLVLTPGFICVKSGGNADVQNRNRVGRMLRGMQASNTFPYKVEPARKRIGQLEGSEQEKLAYSGIISNDQGMISCFICTKKG